VSFIVIFGTVSLPNYCFAVIVLLMYSRVVHYVLMCHEPMYECFDSGHASFIMCFTHSLLAYFSMQSSLVMEHLFAKVNN